MTFYTIVGYHAFVPCNNLHDAFLEAAEVENINQIYFEIGIREHGSIFVTAPLLAPAYLHFYIGDHLQRVCCRPSDVLNWVFNPWSTYQTKILNQLHLQKVYIYFVEPENYYSVSFYFGQQDVFDIVIQNLFGNSVSNYSPILSSKVNWQREGF